LEFSFKTLYNHLARRWHLMVAFGLFGALLATIITGLGPERYRAQAVVMVDQQVDLALPPLSPMDDVLYVSRETVRLEDLSYADILWEEVLDRLTSSQFDSEFGSIEELQTFVSAPHYQDGAWYFTAVHPDPNLAVELSNAWAEAFVGTVQSWVETAQLEISLQSQLETVAGLQASVGDSCGQLDRAWADVDETIQTTLSQADVAENDFNLAISRLAQVEASLQGQSVIDVEALSSDDLDGARQAANGLLAALDLRRTACQARLDSLWQQEESLLEEIEDVLADSYGISPYLRVQVSQLARGAEKVQADLGTAALIGLAVAITLWLMADVTGFLDRTRWSDCDQD
jgi:hypothetical protein